MYEEKSVKLSAGEAEKQSELDRLYRNIGDQQDLIARLEAKLLVVSEVSPKDVGNSETSSQQHIAHANYLLQNNNSNIRNLISQLVI